jgi:2-polyprenyl-3-methyl-5-hydroxy-6-metoxy-1,4-benzoquinol methylase
MAGRIKNSRLNPHVVEELNRKIDIEHLHECPFCKKKSELKYKVQSANNDLDVYNYYLCDECDFLFLGEKYHKLVGDNYNYISRTTNFQVQDEFFSSNPNYQNPDYMYKYWVREKNQILNLGIKSGKILDVGCASGQFLDKFDDRFDKYGIEISDLAAIARTKNINVLKKPFEEINFEDGYFDVITAYALVEHMEDPFSFFEKVTKWLKPGGLLVLGTNDINCLLSRYRKENYQDLIPPEHIILFSYNFYKTYLNKLGYKILYKKYINGGYSFSYNSLLHLLEFGICKSILNKYPFNQLPLYDHFYLYVQKNN